MNFLIYDLDVGSNRFVLKDRTYWVFVQFSIPDHVTFPNLLRTNSDLFQIL